MARVLHTQGVTVTEAHRRLREEGHIVSWQFVKGFFAKRDAIVEGKETPKEKRLVLSVGK